MTCHSAGFHLDPVNNHEDQILPRENLYHFYLFYCTLLAHIQDDPSYNKAPLPFLKALFGKIISGDKKEFLVLKEKILQCTSLCTYTVYIYIVCMFSMCIFIPEVICLVMLELEILPIRYNEKL